MVGGVKAARGDVTKLADMLAGKLRSERVAAILHEPEIVPLAEVGDGRAVEGVAEGVGKHDGPSFVAAGCLEPIHIDR